MIIARPVAIPLGGREDRGPFWKPSPTAWKGAACSRQDDLLKIDQILPCPPSCFVAVAVCSNHPGPTRCESEGESERPEERNPTTTPRLWTSSPSPHPGSYYIRKDLPVVGRPPSVSWDYLSGTVCRWGGRGRGGWLGSSTPLSPPLNQDEWSGASARSQEIRVPPSCNARVSSCRHNSVGGHGVFAWNAYVVYFPGDLA